MLLIRCAEEGTEFVLSAGELSEDFWGGEKKEIEMG